MSSSTRGRLLVSSPELADPNFSRSVLLMIEHTADGALGLVLNRPTDISAPDAGPEWADLLEPPGLVHSGGPVSLESIVGLGRAPDGGHPCVSPLLENLGVLDLHTDPSDLPGISSVRLFAGYSGWSAGQLEVEMAVGSWIIVDAEASDAISADPVGLWGAVLGRQPGLLGQMGTYPDDPSLN